VPGNVELDLQRAGLLEDPLVYDRIKLLKRYETYEWWYERSFTVQETELQGGRVELWFGGVDCLADYWLDGRHLGSSDNMFIEHRFDISAYIVAGHTHTLAVRLSSPVLHAMTNTVYDPSSHALPVNYEQLWVRKAAHSYGWDIFGRAVSAGLWRSVELRCHEKNEIVDLYAATTSVSQERAGLQVHYQLTTEARNVRDGLRLRLTGVCGEAKFTTERDIRFVYGHFVVAAGIR
jgi:beta-mannosidase